MTTLRPLRPYQADAIERLRHSLASGKRRPLLQIPTAGGKTRTAAEIINRGTAKARAAAAAFPCIFCVPAISLIDQTVQAFWDEGIKDVGVLQGNHPLTRNMATVQVASIETLRRRKLPPARLVFIDEAHRRSEFVSAWMRRPEWLNVPFIGLSATPWTKGLGKDYDDLIIVATTADLISSDPPYLSAFRMYAPSHPDLSGIKTVAGDYHEGQLADAMSAPSLVADAVTNWLERGEGRPTLCFAVDRAHARKLCERFNSAGVSAEYMDAFTQRQERTAIGQRLRTGETKVVCNVGVATTGVDWPWVSCLILARPTKSEALYIQIIGRVLRLHPQGGDSLIFDHTDTALRLGLPTEIHHEHLDDGRKATSASKKAKAKPVPLPKECISCGVLKPAKVHKCPSCGFAPVPQSELEFADGQLMELSRSGMTAKSGPGPAEIQQWYAMLVWHALDREYKPSWVDVSFKKRWGDWPERLGVNRGCQPIKPDATVAGWCKSQLIAWQKAKAKDKRRAA